MFDHPPPCIIDTDPGVDDVIALLLALASPEILIRAITVTHGNCTLDDSLTNLRKIFFALEQHLERNPSERSKWPGVDLEKRKELGFGPIEVLLGSAGPIKGDAITAKYFHGRDGLSDIATRHPELTPPSSTTSSLFTYSGRTSNDILPSIIASFPPRSLAYVALGPLTSLAHLHAKDENLLHSLATILIMGGAVLAPGNTSPVAEFNTFADPFAASTIFGLDLPSLHLFPLDITSTLTLPFELYTSLVDPTFKGTEEPSRTQGKSAIAHFTSSFLEGTVEVMAKYGSNVMEQHDPAVIWALIDWARHYSSLSNNNSPNMTNAREGAIDLVARRGSEMRRRVEADGFTRSVLERRRSVELAKLAKLQRDAEAMTLGRVHELGSPDPDELEVLEADEQDQAEDDRRDGEEYGDEEEEEFYGFELEGDEGELAPGWVWIRVPFEVETTGTLTRGMLVIDRRVSATAPAGVAAGRQTNRALALEEADAREVEAAEQDPKSLGRAGTKCLISSPGEDTLRTLLLERIWGVRVGVA